MAADGTSSHEETSSRLQQLFTRLTFATLVEQAPAPAATIGSVVQVAAAHDSYVVPEECEQLHESLVTATAPGAHCSLLWVDGGHATSFVWQSAIFVPACVKAMDLAASAWPKRGFKHVETRADEYSPSAPRPQAGEI